jgi:hypothetical protein
MTTEIVNIHNRDITVIRADEGKVFRRKHDGFVMGNEIFLGNDYSTGTARQDLPEYYEEIDAPEEYFEGLEPILPE